MLDGYDQGQTGRVDIVVAYGGANQYGWRDISMTDDKKGQQQIIAGRVYDDEEVTPILKFLAIFISVIAATTAFAGGQAIKLTNDVNQANFDGIGSLTGATTLYLQGDSDISSDEIKILDAENQHILGDQSFVGYQYYSEEGNDPDKAYELREDSQLAYDRAYDILETTWLYNLEYIDVPEGRLSIVDYFEFDVDTFSDDDLMDTSDNLAEIFFDVDEVWNLYIDETMRPSEELFQQSDDSFEYANNLALMRDYAVKASTIFFSLSGVVAGIALTRRGKLQKLFIGIMALAYIVGLGVLVQGL